MTTVPLTSADVTNYRPLLAMDAAVGGPPGSPNYADYNPTAPSDMPRPAAGSATGDIDDINDPDNEGFDLEDKIRQLLEGKLDDADVEMLIKLIQPEDTDDAPAPAAQDKRRRMGRDQRLVMPSKAEILRRVAVSGEVRAQRAQKQYADLCQRFPALKSARVGG
jgi:hypothetical protein